MLLSASLSAAAIAAAAGPKPLAVETVDVVKPGALPKPCGPGGAGLLLLLLLLVVVVAGVAFFGRACFSAAGAGLFEGGCVFTVLLLEEGEPAGCFGEADLLFTDCFLDDLAFACFGCSVRGLSMELYCFLISVMLLAGLFWLMLSPSDAKTRRHLVTEGRWLGLGRYLACCVIGSCSRMGAFVPNMTLVLKVYDFSSLHREEGAFKGNGRQGQSVRSKRVCQRSH